ncbi:MAG: glycosyltransferase family 2 protein [Prevotella sp.]|nr:glycosyltransferase family 2 protein [Prevotella sp.]
MSNQDIRPSFTIITAVYDQAEEIQKNLPDVLSQQYEGQFDVVVVDESSTDNTADVLKQLKAENKHLYTTFVPKYHFQPNRRRLALSIGVKAAKGNWAIMMEATTPPPSPAWLQELAEFAKKPTVLLLGYVNRKTGDVRLREYEDISQADSIIRKTERWRTSGKGRWKLWLTRAAGYDFMVVRTELGHEVLKLF